MNIQNDNYRFQNIINFINKFSDKKEAKLVYLNIFNILSKNKTDKNYTSNNNGVHFILNKIQNERIVAVEKYIKNFKKILSETQNLEDKGENIFDENDIDDDHYDETIIDFDNESKCSFDDDLFGEF
jgi:hypothetical protein